MNEKERNENEQKRETEAGENTHLPYRWFIKIGKLPTNNVEANDPKFREEIFCPLNDMDMLILHQQEVMEELLEDCYFTEELNAIHRQVIAETWSNAVNNPKGFGDK